MTTECPIAYDHTSELDECAVCGWVQYPEQKAIQHAPPATGLERIQEAIKILSGGYAPKTSILICGDPALRPTDDLDRALSAYHESRNAE